MPLTLESITSSHNPHKKFDAHLALNGLPRIVSFGAVGYQHFTEGHLDADRKYRYIERHQKHEDWKNPLMPGFWSRWYLWDKPTYKEATSNIRHTFYL